MCRKKFSKNIFTGLTGITMGTSVLEVKYVSIYSYRSLRIFFLQFCMQVRTTFEMSSSQTDSIQKCSSEFLAAMKEMRRRETSDSEKLTGYLQQKFWVGTHRVAQIMDPYTAGRLSVDRFCLKLAGNYSTIAFLISTPIFCS